MYLTKIMKNVPLLRIIINDNCDYTNNACRGSGCLSCFSCRYHTDGENIWWHIAVPNAAFSLLKCHV